MYVSGGGCSGLFVDINNMIYCSIRDLHQVIKTSFNGNPNISMIAAGTGWNGSESDMLNMPYGIFFDISFNLYVADCGNDRIQLFLEGQLNATTVVGNGTTDTIALNCPTDVVIDGY